MSLQLTNITSGYNVGKINANFQLLQDQINDKTLWAKDGHNTLGQTLDMNGFDIINVHAINADVINSTVVNGEQGGSGSGSGSVDPQVIITLQNQVGDNTTAISGEIADRLAADSAEALARTAAIQQEVNDRIAAVSAEAALRQQQVTDEINDRIQAVSDEATQRATALSQEAAARGAAITTEQNVRQAVDTSLAQDITTNTSAISGNTSAIQTEQTTRANADSAEATSRELLAVQLRGSYTGSDLNSVTTGLISTERDLRIAQDNSLASQISLLTVASNSEQFDSFKIWYFDSGNEGWGGPAPGPVASGGFLEFVDGTASYVVSPDLGATPVDTTVYPQLKLRIKRTGAPTWAGKVYWLGTSDALWDASRSYTLVEPTYDANGLAVITPALGWTGDIKQIKIELSTSQSSTNGFSLDWVAIGRVAPGASVASVLNEETARIAAVSAEASSREALSVSMTGVADPSGKTLADLTTGLIFDEKTARVQETGVNTDNISSLQVRMPTGSGKLATEASVTTEENARVSGDSANATTISNLQARMPTGTGTLATAASVTSEASARASGDSANASDISGITARLPTGTGKLATEASVTSETSARASGDGANASAISAIQSRMPAGTGAVATAASVTSEASTRASADSANASDISSLSTTVGSHTTSISTINSSLNGIEAKHSVTINSNGNISGYELVGGGSTSAFNVEAGSFSVVDTDANGGVLNFNDGIISVNNYYSSQWHTCIFGGPDYILQAGAVESATDTVINVLDRRVMIQPDGDASFKGNVDVGSLSVGGGGSLTKISVASGAPGTLANGELYLEW